MSHFFQPRLSHWFLPAARPTDPIFSTRVSTQSSVVSRVMAQLRAQRGPVLGSRAVTGGTHSLDQHATVWLAQPLARHIRCDAGVLWLTFDHDARDVVLEAGQTHLCQSDARLSIHALQQGAFRIV